MNSEYENPEPSEEHDSEIMQREELLDARRITIQDVKDHITGPVISTVVHILLLVFFGSIIVFEPPPETRDIEVEMKIMDLKEIEEPPPPPEDPVDPEEATEMPIERPVVMDMMDVMIEDIAVETPSQVEMPSLLNMKMSNSALVLPVPAASGTGQKISARFLNTGGTGSRFLFILDCSASMKPDQFLVAKAHLIKTLEAFKGKGQIAILFFSGPVWLPEEDAKAIHGNWTKKGSAYDFAPKNPNVVPKPRWMMPTKKNVEILTKYIVQEEKTFGTDWRHPFRIAYEMDPQPNVIFFMTDGSVSNDCSGETIDMSKKYAKKITVNTIGFGISDKGIPLLEEIALNSKKGQFKKYTKDEIAQMSQGIKLPTDLTSDTKLSYAKPKPVKVEEEKKVAGLKIE